MPDPDPATPNDAPETGALPARRKAEIDIYLDSLFAQIDAARRPDLPSVILSGTLRCGKTKVARAIAARMGYLRLPTDKIRNATYLDCPEPQKRRIAKYVFRRILLRFPTGVMIEGTGAMDAPCELPLWATRRGIAFFAIGYSFDRPDDKHRDLLAYRDAQSCWTKRSKSDAQMLGFARRVIRRSQEIKAFCEAADLPYFDLDSGRFDAERDRIIHAIEAALSAGRGTKKDAPTGMMARLRFWR